MVENDVRRRAAADSSVIEIRRLQRISSVTGSKSVCCETLIVGGLRRSRSGSVRSKVRRQGLDGKYPSATPLTGEWSASSAGVARATDPWRRFGGGRPGPLRVNDADGPFSSLESV